MQYGRYIGPIEELRGMTALLEPRGNILAAQFDSRVAIMPEGHEFVKPGTNMGFGWHRFNKYDWMVD
jgi:hypothetical protein